MPLQTYCQNSIKAEITFSLTGGREGKIISENPPVQVYFGAVDKHWYIRYFYRESTGEVEEKGTVFFTAYPSPAFEKKYIPGDKVTEYKVYQPFSSGSPGLIYIERQEQEYINGEYIVVLSVIEKEIFIDLDGDSMSSQYELVNNTFLISDVSGVLYSHPVPQGFTMNYSVNCTGCSNGECAGGNGKGGVICMDCEKVKNELNTIKGYLK